MELALYAPGLGYYERQADIGRSGDFYTSVSVGPLFGSLLARQFADWLGKSDCQADGAGQGIVRLVEIGAHRGQLASDILRWFKDYAPGLSARMEYVIVEPSESRRGWQKETLVEFDGRVRWVGDLCQVGEPGKGIRGIVFSNELLDAMPVHRLRWNGTSRQWDEWLVGVDAARETFVWQTGPLGPGLERFCPSIPAELAAVIPDGFTTEISPAASEWWGNSARLLERGYLVGFDYGWSAEEFLAPERGKGTLRTYSKHRVSDNLLENPGDQDITAHVNFTTVQESGEAEGLETVCLLSQRECLTRIFERVIARPEEFQPWTPALIRQFQTLTHPEHLGRAFKVLVQRR